VLYLHHDQQGSTRMLTSSSGTVSGTTTFDGFGNKLGATGTASTPLGYDGQYTSADTGLIYLRARSYDPSTAQFLSVDPLVEMTSEQYGFAKENPLDGADASGLSTSLEVPEGLCLPPYCLPPPPPVIGEAIEAPLHLGKEVIVGVFGSEEQTDEGTSSVTKWNQEAEGDCPPPDGPELRRKGEELLGRGHNPARKPGFDEWWKTLDKAAKKAYDKAGGPRPRKAT
jgi:RHS repeat-associated protein